MTIKIVIPYSYEGIVEMYYIDSIPSIDVLTNDLLVKHNISKNNLNTFYDDRFMKCIEIISSFDRNNYEWPSHFNLNSFMETKTDNGEKIVYSYHIWVSSIHFPGYKMIRFFSY